MRALLRSGGMVPEYARTAKRNPRVSSRSAACIVNIAPPAYAYLNVLVETVVQTHRRLQRRSVASGRRL